jgi:hypothetical protein
MKRILILLQAVCFSSLLFAQEKVAKSVRITNIAYGEANMETDNLLFAPVVTHMIHEPEIENEEFEEYKNKLNLEKIKNRGNSIISPVVNENKKSRAVLPTVGTNFKANSGNGTPPDNSMAVNTAGQIVSMVNSNIQFYNTSGTLSYTRSMSSFFNLNYISSPNPAISTDQCDPKVLFDCGSKRFIVFGMTCTGDNATSRLLIAVSKTENPSSGWNAYAFNADALQTGVWFDYPRIGYSNDDVFVSGNMFNNSGSFEAGYIYQFDKAGMMAGNTNIQGLVHYNLPGFDFSMTSVQQGLCSSNTSGFHYLVSSSAFPTTSTRNKISLYEIKGKATDATSPTVAHTQVTTNLNYNAPADGSQQGSAVLLNTGDCRMQDAYILGNTIHTVHHTNTSTGYCGIFYTKIVDNGTALTATSKIIGNSAKEYSFPAIENFSNTNTVGTDQQSLITFLSSGDNEYPGMKAICIDGNLNTSNIVTGKTGTGPVEYLSEPKGTYDVTRWGDYSSAEREFGGSTTKPTVWSAGCFGNSANATNKEFSSWLVKYTNESFWPAGVSNVSTPKEEVKVYPNPNVSSTFFINIKTPESQKANFILTDVLGAKIADLLQTDLLKGENVFQFSTESLASGVYFVKIIGDKGINISEQYIKK